MLKADLHIHTTASDGKLTPSKVVVQALQTDLDVIAITDHDTIAGVEEARAAAKGTQLRVVEGVEISTLFQNRECHLLAYAFRDADLLAHLLRDQKKKRVQRARCIIGKLNGMGFDITYDEVLGESGRAPIGRPHIARVMIRKGYAADTQEVFFRYLGNDSSAYYKIDYPEVTDVIDCVHKAGGIAILAHPGSSYNFIEIKQLKDAGLDGLECFHSSHNAVHRRRYLTYCQSHDMVATGGSDFHGTVQDYYHFGGLHITLEPDSPLLENSGNSLCDKPETQLQTLCK